MTSLTHIRRMFFLLVVAGALGLVGQRLLQPKSFGQYGHYRGDSLGDFLELEIIHQGRDVCAECHDHIAAIHAKDVHVGIECEDCHGPGNVHTAFHRDQEGSGISAPDAVMPKKYTLEGCLFCHRKLAARPSTFAQIDPAEHYAFLNVVDPQTQCIECHSPHEPLFLLDGVEGARIHPVISECSDCHDEPPTEDHLGVEDHPTIFVCRDCHPSVVRDFAQHEHAALRCTTCHLFWQEDETHGRIFQNGNRKFCLLCHELKPFKDPTWGPMVEFPEHIVERAAVMRRDPEPLLEDPTACLQCHFDYVHDSRLIRRLQEQER